MAHFANPFRPGAGHMPPYLAGRESEQDEFRRLLKQSVVLENLVLTGLRGVGKTVLLETFKPIAIAEGWAWVGTDLSESTAISEERIAIRLMTDLSVLTSAIPIAAREVQAIGFGAATTKVQKYLDFAFMRSVFESTPGLVSDKIKAVLELSWNVLKNGQIAGKKIAGIVFAYDEAQNLADHSDTNEFPLSLLLDVFQSLQRKQIPFLLALAGLPTLFPKLVEARTYAERMFRVVFLSSLDDAASKDAIKKPISDANCPVQLSEKAISSIIEISGGYPYFIQFICREVYDAFLQKAEQKLPFQIPISDITRKLDSDFFAGRWARATDRQRDLMSVIASLPSCEDEFTVQEIAEASKSVGGKAFSPSHINQMLAALSKAGLVYKNRHGKYSFAVPLLGQFIRRQNDG